jgi:hypothetical protein
MYKLRLPATPQCTCGFSKQFFEHVYQECPLYDPLRGMYWPNGSTLHSMLYGHASENCRIHQRDLSDGINIIEQCFIMSRFFFFDFFCFSLSPSFLLEVLIDSKVLLV